MRRTRVALAVLAPLIVFLLALAAPPAPAEDDDDQQRLMPFLVRDTNPARFAVREARRLLAAGRVTPALRVAQTILDERPEEYLRLPGGDASTRWRLAAEEMRGLLASLDADGRATYDRLSRPSTGPLLERAARERSTALLEDVATRYGASTDGIEAARRLADLAMEAGSPRDAAWWALRGLEFAERDAGLWQLHIDALGQADDGAALAALRLPPDLEATPTTDPASVAASLAAWRLRRPPPPAPLGWPLWGGDPSRASIPPTSGPRPEKRRWSVRTPMARGRLDHQTLRGNFGRTTPHIEPWLRSFRPLHPAVDDRFVYVADGRSVKALDLYSGTEVWSFDAESERGLALLTPGDLNPGRTSFDRVYAPVLHRDVVFATVEVAHRYDRELLQGIEISTYLPRRLVVALDRRSGALRWSMGQSEADAALLEGMSAVSPCVAAEGLVIVAGSRYESLHQVFLLAFDAQTGALAWIRPLAWGQQESNLFGAPVKELAASAPAVADGTVYASMGLGFVAAVDLHSGHPLWLASYQVLPIAAVQYWHEAPLRFPRVTPSPPMVIGDLLLVAPSDGRHLHAFDRKDGQLRWRTPYPPTPQLGAPASFLGVGYDGKRHVALLTGSDVVAHDVEDGSVAWIGRLQDQWREHNVPVGRGAITPDEVLVPTTNGLVHFSLSREGAFARREPWPRLSEAGNLLPLERVLLVSARERVQAFYSWDEIEHDVARRRQARPGDPTILIEAGEIYRMGGALERAERAFRDALDLAQKADDPRAIRRAEQGLYLTWTSAAEAIAATAPQQAITALEKALAWARSPSERVETRIRLDGLLIANPQAQAQNLQRLADEASGVRAVFPGDDAPVPARAMALLRLARVQIDAGEPRAAVEALQALLRDGGDDPVRGVPGRDRARRLVDEIVRVWGPEAYASQEQAAVELLGRASAPGGADLLERLLREYPNASVVPEALFRQGAAWLAEGRAAEAAEVLRRLLGEHGESPVAPRAAAALSDAYARAGLPGAQRFALLWLEVRHAETSFEYDGVTTTGRAFATSHRPAPRLPLPAADSAMTLPLTEVHFESVDEESWGREVEVATCEGVTSPVALLTDGRGSIIAFDLVGGRVAFRLSEGSFHRAFYDDGVLVLASGRLMRGVTADTGQRLWEAEIDGTVVDLEGGDGQGYLLVHDVGVVRGTRRVLAFDPQRGRTLWTLDLESASDVREIQTHGPDVLLREMRNQDQRLWPAMLVVDGLAGRMRHVIGLPSDNRTEAGPLAIGRALVTAARDRDGVGHLTAFALDTGETLWTHPLAGQGRTASLVGDGEALVVLQEDGSLSTHALTDGSLLAGTRIFTGESADATPIHDTHLLVASDVVYLLPRSRRPPWYVGAWDRTTGKLRWHRPWDEDRSPGRCELVQTSGRLVALAPYASTRAAAGEVRPPTRVVARVIDPATGDLLQEVEPIGIAPDYGLISMAHGWGTIVVFGKAGAVVYAAPR